MPRTGRERTPTVVVVGTLDTKGNEYAYLRDRLRERGMNVLLVDGYAPRVMFAATRAGAERRARETAAAAALNTRGSRPARTLIRRLANRLVAS